MNDEKNTITFVDAYGLYVKGIQEVSVQLNAYNVDDREDIAGALCESYRKVTEMIQDRCPDAAIEKLIQKNMRELEQTKTLLSKE